MPDLSVKVDRARSRLAGFTKGSCGGRQARLLEQRDPMQKDRTEKNERSTLQCKFYIRSLEGGEHASQHLFLS